MIKIEDGGPAYPVEMEFNPGSDRIGGLQTGPYTHWETGLTKREAFAMAAMQGMAAAGFRHDLIPKASVVLADALLAALRGDANV